MHCLIHLIPFPGASGDPASRTPRDPPGRGSTGTGGRPWRCGARCIPRSPRRRRPVPGVLERRRHREVDRRLHPVLRNRLPPRRARGFPQKTADALREKAIPPAPHRRPRHPGPADRLHQTEARVEPWSDAPARRASGGFAGGPGPVRQPGFPVLSISRPSASLPFCRTPATAA